MHFIHRIGSKRISARSGCIFGAQVQHRIWMSKMSGTGASVLSDALLAKGSAFSLQERERRHLRGLLPTAVLTLDDQVSIAMKSLGRIGNDLGKYEFMLSLLGTNAHVFYTALLRHTKDLMSIVYTPVVGHACQEYGSLSIPSMGLRIGWADALCNGGPGIQRVLSNWHTKVQYL